MNQEQMSESQKTDADRSNAKCATALRSSNDKLVIPTNVQSLTDTFLEVTDLLQLPLQCSDFDLKANSSY